MDKEEQELMSALKDLKQPVSKIDLVLDNAPGDVNALNGSSDVNNHLNELNETKNKIIEIKKNLNIIIDTIMANPSFVTRAANAWGELSTWKKVGTGLVLTFPPILVGVAANVATLLTLGGITGIVYTTSGIILEDHHACSNDTKQKIKDGIAGITGILEITIHALNKIHFQLQAELDKFKKENFKLAEQVIKLHSEVDTFCDEVERLSKLNIELAQNKKQLEQTCKALEQSNEHQSELFAKTQHELRLVENEYQQTCDELKLKVNELATVRKSMMVEVVKAGIISKSLQKVVSHFSVDVIDEPVQQDDIEVKLTNMLHQEKMLASRLVQRFKDTQVELRDATDDMKKSSEDNHNLLTQQQKIMQRLESVNLLAIQSMYPKKTSTLQNESTFFYHGMISNESSISTEQISSSARAMHY